MILKFVAAVVAFLLIVAGFNYTGSDVSGLIVAIVAFLGAYLAFKYTPND